MRHENHPDGFLRHGREVIGRRPPAERATDYREIYFPKWDEAQMRRQGERCMDCGVPTCMAGCPIGNLIPDWNDLVSRADWKHAIDRLHATNNFPEFTGYTCPAPCEDACTLAYNAEPVSIKDTERAIYDRAWSEGWIVPVPPGKRTSRCVAVVGSGPAGLAAAQQLNRAGHRVTVFERDDEIGGLMTYGIPDFKFAKDKVARRVAQLAEEGIEFRTSTDVGNDVALESILDSFDATCLAVGALRHRDVVIPGRELEGVYFGMGYLTGENRRQAGKGLEDVIDARDKRVVVLGGGDTGADCVATAHRQGAEEVTQVSIRRRPPEERPPDNPWPWPSKTYRKSYAQEEGGTEQFNVESVAFLDEDGDGHVDSIHARGVEWTYDEAGRRREGKVVVPDLRIPADLVLIAIGFAGPETDPLWDCGIEVDADGTIRTDANMMTRIPGLFAAGDANMGASLVVWAIGEGRDVARMVDLHLTGHSDLPASLRTANPPLFP